MGGRDGNWPKIKVPWVADVLASWGGLGTKRVWEICENKNASVSQGCSSFRGASFIHCTDIITSPSPGVSMIGTTPMPNPLIITSASITNLIGSAYDPLSNPVTWQVLLFDSSDPNAAPINVTPGPLTNGFHGGALTNASFGTVDLTAVQNGAYTLTLLVRSVNGVSTATLDISLNSNLKLGAFSFSQQDLVLPVNGIPLTVTRTYNSLNPHSGDFGYGWTYALNDMDVAIDEQRQEWQLGTGPVPVDLEDNGTDSGSSPIVNVRTGGGWDVTLTLPDGRRTTFQASFQPVGYYYYPQWTAAPGVNYALTTTDGSFYDALFGYWNDTYDLAFNNYDISGFLLVDNNSGTQYYLTRGQANYIYYDTTGNGDYVNAQVCGPPKLTKILQRSLASIQIGNSGVTNRDPSGNITRTITFDRDAQGRITGAYDPNAGAGGFPAVKYIYDSNGNLFQVQKLVDRNAATYATDSFGYTNASFPHYITGITNADGTQVAKNFYDDSGKLIAVQDANGNLTRFIHNTTNNMEVVIDRLGHTNTYVYDTRGNVTAQTNALNQVTTMAYDANNNKTNSTVYLNGQPVTSSYVYDPYYNLLLSSTDPLGHTNGFTYDGYGNMLTSADALGHVTANTYDGNGNLTNTTDALRNQTASFYVNSLLTGSQDAVGTVTTNYYDNSGNLTTNATLASGTILSSNTFAYDLNGNRTGSTVWRKVNGFWTPASTTFVYDGQNRVVQTIDPDGGTSTVVYDPTGKQQATIDKLGRTTSYLYDGLGRLVQTTYPDLTTETSAYDAAGNRTNSVDRASRVTTYAYDALNRLTNTTYADGTISTTVYDGVGRVAQTIDARGTVTGFNYDAAGRRLAVTNAVGTSVAVTNFYSYDANGNQITFTDSLGHTTTNFYDALNRQTNVTFADGTRQITIYDAAGRRIAQTDQATNTTGFAYDGAGRLTAVTNALNQVTRYQYDEAGNEIAQIDALNRTTTFAYDSMGRRISHTMPDTSLIERFSYDLLGNLIRHTNFTGIVITNQYDVMNRLTNRTSINGYQISYTYTLTGQRQTMTDPSGMTTYLYDNRDRLTNKVVNWGSPAQLSVALNYSYDANGNPANLWSSTANGVTNIYQYDALNRLTNVVEQASSLCKYTYDLAGNLQTMRYGNGVTNLYQYDSLNRLTNSVWKLNAGTLASFYFQLGLTGNRTGVIEYVKDSWRTNQWQYDPLYRMTYETIKVGAASDTLGYGYDPVGNRTNRTSTSGLSGWLPSVTNSFTTNDWLKTDAYDNNGNTLWSTNGTVQGPYFYDVENRLTNFNNTIYIAYNGDGVRVRKISGTTTNYYLVDDRNPSGYVQVLEEHQALSGQSPALKRVYNYGLDLVSQREAVGTVYYFGYDGHGSTRILFDTGGTAVQKFSYDAYGTLIDSNAAPATVYLYCGEQFDPDLGFYYLRAPRYLNPGTGRFTTMDTFAGNNEDPLSLHKYLYCQADPVNNTDPSGNDIEGMLDVMDISGTLDGIGLPMASMAQNRALQLGGIDVDVYIWKWKNLGVTGPGQHSVGHVMVIDHSTTGDSEVSQFPDPREHTKGKNTRLDYTATLNAEENRVAKKFLAHLPNDAAFHSEVDNQRARSIWDWWPTGPNETQCARAGYNVLKAGGLPLWGYGNQGEILPGDLLLKLEQLANFNRPSNPWSVEPIQ
jgi:RHS repeat-associated protein